MPRCHGRPPPASSFGGARCARKGALNARARLDRAEAACLARDRLDAKENGRPKDARFRMLASGIRTLL